MWAALETGVPTVNGRYGNEPPGWPLRLARRAVGDSAGRRQIEDAIAAWLSYNCLDPEDVCWLETDGELTASALRRQISWRRHECSER